MQHITPDWLDPLQLADICMSARDGTVQSALTATRPSAKEFAILLSETAAKRLEEMAQKAHSLTMHHFGNTVSLYVPLYLSNYCTGGCSYCGFASDREQRRYRLSRDQVRAEVLALKKMGFEDILLLTGERTPEADFEYLKKCVEVASPIVHNVSVESFAMTADEYEQLAKAGCNSITLYQETYDPDVYEELHRWGPKRDYAARLEAQDRALAAGMRSAGLGALLGLADPVSDMIALYQHARHLQRSFWRSGVMISFPRICEQRGDFSPPYSINDRQLAQIVFAFRICMPDVPLVLSTREHPAFRDGMAGVGISRMSAASRTTVGGYVPEDVDTGGQFSVSDTRDVAKFCQMLESKGLDPVFKNWDAVFQA
ncbi:MAG: 2-iminoacetate synthase ThiH [Kiritimatiellia bacterium]|jgi:2-iminoacetate synthase|nr:2-iminoacetate synthase ThiH [Kiritimatiellia bacterium]MDP6848842.1 2-iminoacetate synthase ThiH [Kiritimatiellia bacterium]